MNATELARAKETRCRNCGELIVLDEQEVFWLGTRSWYHPDRVDVDDNGRLCRVEDDPDAEAES